MPQRASPAASCRSCRTLGTMKSRLLSVVSSSLLSFAALMGIAEAECILRKCLHDDAGIRAMAMMAIPMLVAYLSLSWLVVYPAVLWLSRWLGGLLASLLVSLGFAVVMTWLFHLPSVDGRFLHTAMYLVPWFGLPWFVGGLCAKALWPVAGVSGRASGA